MTLSFKHSAFYAILSVRTLEDTVSHLQPFSHESCILKQGKLLIVRPTATSYQNVKVQLQLRSPHILASEMHPTKCPELPIEDRSIPNLELLHSQTLVSM